MEGRTAVRPSGITPDFHAAFKQTWYKMERNTGTILDYLAFPVYGLVDVGRGHAVGTLKQGCKGKGNGHIHCRSGYCPNLLMAFNCSMGAFLF